MHQICLQFVLNTLRSYRDATMVSTSSYLVLRASKTISYCAPLRCAQALRLAALQLISRAGSAAQGKGLFPSLPSIYATPSMLDSLRFGLLLFGCVSGGLIAAKLWKSSAKMKGLITRKESASSRPHI